MADFASGAQSTMTRCYKVLQIFLHSSVLAPQRDTLGGEVHQTSLYSYLQNFVPFRRPISEISAAKLRQFLPRNAC